MKNPDLTDVSWSRSSFSSTPEKTCVEVAMGQGFVAVRNSNHPSVVVVFTITEWDKFLKGVSAGEFKVTT